MLDAFSHGKDVWIRSLHVIVRDDAAIHLQTRFASQLHVGANARGDDHKIRLDGTAVFEHHAFCFAVAENPGGIAFEKHFHTEAFHFCLEVTATNQIELPFHQRVHQVDDRHVAALHL